MDAIVQRRRLTKALADYLAASTGRPFGIGKAPEPADAPYGIVYPLDGGEFEGAMAGPERIAALPYQVTYVGEQIDQVEWLADRGRRALNGRTAGTGLPVGTPAPAGMTVVDVATDSIGEPDPEGEIVSQPDRFTITVAANP